MKVVRAVRLPDLRSPPGVPPPPPSQSGWYALQQQGVSVPSLEDARRCVPSASEGLPACGLRTVRFDPPNRTVIVAAGSGALTVEVEISPGFPEHRRPVLVVRELLSSGETTIDGEVVGKCRTLLRFEWELSPFLEGTFELSIQGIEGEGSVVTLGGETTVIAFDPCALTLVPGSQVVGFSVEDPPEIFPLPPLVAVDPRGCILEAWFTDHEGRTVIPRAENRVDVFLNGCQGLLTSVALDEPILDAVIFGECVAVLTAGEVLLFELDGCSAEPAAIAGGLTDPVALGVSVEGLLIVIQRTLGAPPLDHNVLLFRADGSQVKTPTTFSGRGWYASNRSPALVFDRVACVYTVDPSRVAGGCCAEAPRPLSDEESLLFRLIDDLGELRGRTAFPESGTVILGPAREGDPLDAGRPGSQWHRVLLFGEIPDGCGVRVETRAFDDVLAGDPLIPTGWSLPVLATPSSSVPVSSPGDTRLAAADAMVLARPGRFLWLRLTLLSNGVATPRITSLEIEQPRVGVARFLPAVFRRSTVEDDFLRRWLALFENTAFDGVAERLDAYSELFDPRYAPVQMLPFLGAWLEVLELARQRRDPETFRHVLAHADELARTRGTVAGLILAVKLYLGFEVQIVESYKTRSGFVFGAGATLGDVTGPVLGCHTILTSEHSPTWLGDEPLLGCSFLLGCEARSGTVPYNFDVLVPARFLCSSEDLSMLETVIRTEKPAHTTFRIRPVAAAGFVVGAGSVVGQEISGAFDRDQIEPSTYGIVLGNGPPRPKPIGLGFALGRDSRLEAGRTSPGWLVGSAVSTGIRLGA